VMPDVTMVTAMSLAWRFFSSYAVAVVGVPLALWV